MDAARPAFGAYTCGPAAQFATSLHDAVSDYDWTRIDLVRQGFQN